MCWNMYGWLQIFRSCMMVFIRVLVPPLPCGGRREALHWVPSPGRGWGCGGGEDCRTGLLQGR